MKILVLANFGMGLYKFRRELLEELINKNHEVYISLPNDQFVSKLVKLGCKFIDTKIGRRGINLLSELKLLFHYIKMIRSIKPDVVLTYTIKPNVYGGIASRLTNVAYLSNVTGLGTTFENKGLMQNITRILYKVGLKKANCVFFQNIGNRNFFIEQSVVSNNTRLIPGSGVNLKQYQYEEYPSDDGNVRFLFIGRIMKSKGIEELFQAAKIIKNKYPNVQFDIVGGLEEDYNSELEELTRKGIVTYHGQQNDVRAFIKNSHAIILPSYHEGLANVLLETASIGRPVLASKVPGCIETFDEGVSGFGFEAKCIDSLVKSLDKFINLPNEIRVKMGIAGRKKMEIEFNRHLVVDAYIDEIDRVICEEKLYEFV